MKSFHIVHETPRSLVKHVWFMESEVLSVYSFIYRQRFGLQRNTNATDHTIQAATLPEGCL